MEGLLDSKEVAKELGCSLDHLRKLNIPVVRLGRLVRYRRQDVTDHIAKSTRKAVLNEDQNRPSFGRFAPFGTVEVDGWFCPRAKLLRRGVVKNGADPKKDVHYAIVGCPFCGEEHRHGWGTGLRDSHCRERPAGAPTQYWIDCPDNHPVAAVY